MLQSVIVLHAGHGREFAMALPESLAWKTCLREVAFLLPEHFRADALGPGDAVFSGADAYRFLLEVVCGLHSPMVGETEVMGQFRAFVARLSDQGGRWRALEPFCQRVLADAKAVRTQHLAGLGARSYGTLAARYLAGLPRVAIIGGGQLTHAVLPALADRAVRLYARRPSVAAVLVNRYPRVRVHALSEPPARGSDLEPMGLIIAAPMSACDVHAWVDRQGRRFAKILDLRAEGDTDELQLPDTNIVSFAQVLADLEVNRGVAAQRVEAARRQIEHRTQQYSRRCDIRPFGWEDLCA